MRRYRRNTALVEIVRRYPTAGLPLFEDSGQRIPSRARKIARSAPRAVEVATPTRNLAHRSVTYSESELTKKQMQVLEVIREVSMTSEIDVTNQEIADRLNWSVNRVTGRTFELRNLGAVVPSRRRMCRSTGFVVQAWRTP